MITPSFGLTATERVLPKLALDFTTASLDPRVTFTRATSVSNPATYVNSSGLVTAATNNQPRFDYDPTTLACKGLLIEESRTNVLTNSEQFDAASWTLTATGTGSLPVVTPNDSVAPDGTTSADRIVMTLNGGTSSTDRSYISQTGLVSSAASIWLKTANNSTVQITIRNGNNSNQIITVTPAWTRFQAINTSTTDSTFFIGLRGGVGTGVTDTVDLHFWGAQLEAGAFPTSYIPTESTALTRNADVATMTGTNFSSWFNASEGTLYAQGTRFGTANSFPRMFQFDDGTDTNYIYVGQVTSSNQGNGAVAVSGSEVTGFATVAVGTGVQAEVVMSYKANNFALSVNSSTTQTDSAGSIPTVNQAIIGFRRAGSNNYMNGYIAKLMYWPQQLTNNEVRAFSK